MTREAPRTLRSLSPGYQQGIHPDDYEVIVVENGSSAPLGGGLVQSFGRNFRYYAMPGPRRRRRPRSTSG